MVVACLAAVAVAYAASSTPLYLQPGAPIPDRVKDLVGRMNMAEKVSAHCLATTACTVCRPPLSAVGRSLTPRRRIAAQG